MKRYAWRAGLPAAALISACLLSSCGGQKETVPDMVLTYAENQTDSYPTTQGAQYFADLLKERTDGRIQVIVYPDAQLGDETSTVEQVTFGGIDMVRCSIATITDYSPACAALMMPYLYTSSDHMWTVLDGEIGQEVMDTFDGTGLVPLSWYDAGVRNFYFRDEVDSLDDFQDLRIRVQPTEMMEDMVQLLGASPVPMNYEDVYAALQKGTVDGAENNWNSYAAMQHYQVAPYFLEDEHIRIPELQLISQTTMDECSSEDQQIIRECAKESAIYERKLWAEQESNAIQEAKDGGCVELDLTEEQRQEFENAMAPLYDTYCSDYMDLIERIRAVQE